MNSQDEKGITVILQEEINSTDILCGRDKRAFNHVANRRFRFLTALNLERYREAESRRAKTLVVHSLYHQIIDNGGRFLVEQTTRNNGPYYTPASDKTAREKISHALRDKFPLSSLGDVKIKLHEQRRGGLLSTRFVDETFMAANTLILQVKLPQNRHTSDIHVEGLLTAELYRMCSNQGIENKATRTDLPIDDAARCIRVSPRLAKAEARVPKLRTLDLAEHVINEDDEFDLMADTLCLPQLPPQNDGQNILETLLTAEHQQMSSNQGDGQLLEAAHAQTRNSFLMGNMSVQPTSTPQPTFPQCPNDNTEDWQHPLYNIDANNGSGNVEDDVVEDDGMFLPQSFSAKDCQDLLSVLDRACW